MGSNVNNALELKIEAVELRPGQLWDDRFLRARIISLLLCPTLRKPRRVLRYEDRNAYLERERILEVFVAEVVTTFRKEQARGKALAPADARRLSRLLKDTPKRTLHLLLAHPPAYYLPEWDITNRSDDVEALREIYSVGLLVLILDELAQTSGSVRIEDAKASLYLRYKTGRFWAANSDSFPKAWGRLRSVAHLCAALVRILREQRSLKRHRAAFTVMRRNMTSFLVLAKYYEELLTEKPLQIRMKWNIDKARNEKARIAPLMKSSDLWRLPSTLKTSGIKPMEKLPKVGRRPLEEQAEILKKRDLQMAHSLS